MLFTILLANEAEAVSTLNVALEMKHQGKIAKAKKLFDHAYKLCPTNADVLTEFGLFEEEFTHDVVQAEHLYSRALIFQPDHEYARKHQRRTLPLVEDIDFKMLELLDRKREAFLKISADDRALRRAKQEAYFQHVYHSVAIEGNTMSYLETRSVLETHYAVAGKSVVEHNEVLGMDLALRFLDQVLVHRLGKISLQDIKEIHQRVFGFVDPLLAGKFRSTQVFVGNFAPTAPEAVPIEMDEFVVWLNDENSLAIHPVELAALVHYKFVVIHPFIDGNGRTARLLMNLILMQAGFPPVIIRLEDRLKYYETLKAANEGDLRPFIRFVANSTGRTLDEYLFQTSEIPENWKAKNYFQEIPSGRTILLGKD